MWTLLLVLVVTAAATLAGGNAAGDDIAAELVPRLSLPGLAADGGETVEEAELGAARATWAAAGIERYSYTIRRQNFGRSCSVDLAVYAPDYAAMGPITCDEALPCASCGFPIRVEDLFRLVEERLAARLVAPPEGLPANCVPYATATYNDYGVPVAITYGEGPCVADSDVTITVTNFAPF